MVGGEDFYFGGKQFRCLAWLFCCPFFKCEIRRATKKKGERKEPDETRTCNVEGVERRRQKLRGRGGGGMGTCLECKSSQE